MAACTSCGTDIKEGVRFCRACGRDQDSPQSGKKARVLAGEKGSRTKFIVIGAVAVALVASVAAFSQFSGASGGMRAAGGARRSAPATNYTRVTAEKGEVRIAMSDLKAGTAGYYLYEGDGAQIKFFLLQAADGTLRAALDACQACYRAKLGYRQDGDRMVCNNCGMGFRSTDVGIVTGGCNPIPLEKRQDGALLVVKVKDLEAGAKYF